MKNIKISPHALLAYMKRVKGIRVTSYEEEIKNLITNHPELKNGKNRINGNEYIVRNNTLITILSPKYIAPPSSL